MSSNHDIEMGRYRSAPLPISDFLNGVETTRRELDQLTTSIDRLTTLHQRALSSTSPDAVQREIDSVAATAHASNSTIREKIQALKDDAENTSGAAFGQKKAQLEAVTRMFQGLLQKFLDEEKGYQARRREAVARQYRVVNPYASEAMVREVVEGGEQVQVFQNVLNDGRSTQASGVLGAVRARQQELQHIEQSIAELTQLFQDVETLALRSEPVAQQSAYNAEVADEHISQGIKQIEVAQGSAERRRRLKWWCLGVGVAIVIVVAIIILVWLKVTGQI